MDEQRSNTHQHGTSLKAVLRHWCAPTSTLPAACRHGIVHPSSRTRSQAVTTALRAWRAMYRLLSPMPHPTSSTLRGTGSG